MRRCDNSWSRRSKYLRVSFDFVAIRIIAAVFADLSFTFLLRFCSISRGTKTDKSRQFAAMSRVSALASGEEIGRDVPGVACAAKVHVEDNSFTCRSLQNLMARMFRPVLHIFIVFGAASFLAGCADFADLGAAPSPAAAPAKTQTSMARPTRPAANANRSPTASRGEKGQAGVKTQGGAKPADATKEEQNVQGEPKAVNLVGLDQSDVAKALGPPMAETDKAPGKIWRYWNSRCAVDVSLYLDVQSRSYRVLAYEVTNYDNSPGSRNACLAELPKSNIQPASYDGQ